jgi:hypothetical protein
MRISALSCLFVIVALGLGDLSVRADDLLPPDRPVDVVVDFYIDAKLAAENLAAAPPADDANFIRRVTLDLAGRVPASSEVQAYLQSSEPDKKSWLVDRLLASPDFPYHQRNEFDLVLMAGKGSPEWRAWLLMVLVENRPWPQMFRDLMLAREDDPNHKNALAFLKTRATNIDDLTNDTSKIFFGVSINCAKCHDHPLVLDWTQDHYFGMASFFNRTYLTKKNFLAERDDGVLKFRTTAGEEKQASLMFLTGKAIDEPQLAALSDDQKKAAEEKQKADQERETPPEPPAFSRRAQFVEVALQPNPSAFFPKAFVNRIWARLLGTGLVTPLDQMHSENKPSHPELLAWLARDVETHNYDLKRLIRGLVLSRAYARSSRWETPGERPSDRLFAVAVPRPLTPAQFSLSLSIATANPLELAAAIGKPEEWVNRRRDFETQADKFAAQVEIPGENFQVGVSEAMLFSNSPQIEAEYLRDSTDRLPGTLKAISDRPQMIQTAFMALFSRAAQAEEVEAISAYLAAREDRPLPALQQMLWSLVTSGEFRFNY